MLETLNDFTRSLGSVWGLLSVLVVCAPAALAVHEFTAYRMNQYTLTGSDYGCKSNMVNFEARAVNANIVTRRCVLMSMGEISVDRMKELIENKAGSILIAMPEDPSSLSKDEIDNWNEVEEVLMEQAVDTSVYFTYQKPELMSIYHEVRTALNSDHAATAAAALGNVFHSNGYQIVTYGTAPAPTKSSLYTIQGKMLSQGRETNPSIAIVAHFDSYGIAPHLAKSANGNGSGVAALLEIARLLSKLYSKSGNTPKYDVLFLLSSGGKLNYLASKTWLEKKLSSDSLETVLLNEVEFVLCLDGIGNDGLHLHVSKPPKEGTAAHKMLSAIEEAVALLNPNISVNTVPKKVNLGNPLFAWHHEIFTVKRLSAATISNFPAYNSLGRLNTFDTKVDVDKLYAHTHIIAEGISRYVSDLSDQSVTILDDYLVPSKALLSRTVEFLTNTQRAATLLQRDSPVIVNLEQTLSKYASEVLVSELKASKRDPEFQFYDQTETKLFAYNVKPAVFDLFLAIAVIAYLGTIYLCVKSIPHGMTYLYQMKKLKSS